MKHGRRGKIAIIHSLISSPKPSNLNLDTSSPFQLHHQNKSNSWIIQNCRSINNQPNNFFYLHYGLVFNTASFSSHNKHFLTNTEQMDIRPIWRNWICNMILPTSTLKFSPIQPNRRECLFPKFYYISQKQNNDVLFRRSLSLPSCWRIKYMSSPLMYGMDHQWWSLFWMTVLISITVLIFVILFTFINKSHHLIMRNSQETMGTKWKTDDIEPGEWYENKNIW